MGVVDWRAWTDQNGGTLPTAPNPPGTPWQNNMPFPGVNPISDLISGSSSVPTYPNTPTTINAVDPFYIGTYALPVSPTGAGWVSPMDRMIVPSPFTPGTQTVAAWTTASPGGNAGITAPIMRPVVAGITS